MPCVWRTCMLLTFRTGVIYSATPKALLWRKFFTFCIATRVKSLRRTEKPSHFPQTGSLLVQSTVPNCFLRSNFALFFARFVWLHFDWSWCQKDFRDSFGFLSRVATPLKGVNVFNWTNNNKKLCQGGLGQIACTLKGCPENMVIRTQPLSSRFLFVVMVLPDSRPKILTSDRSGFLCRVRRQGVAQADPRLGWGGGGEGFQPRPWSGAQADEDWHSTRRTSTWKQYQVCKMAFSGSVGGHWGFPREQVALQIAPQVSGTPLQAVKIVPWERTWYFVWESAVGAVLPAEYVHGWQFKRTSYSLMDIQPCLLVEANCVQALMHGTHHLLCVQQNLEVV